ncbi:MAG: PA14 domain-containing protein [bacterium]|nr:PA14 domain-containing protein [bacterium]
MKKSYWLFPLLVIFPVAFIAGVLSASNGNEGGGIDPWYSVKYANRLPNAISFTVTYGDLDRGCRCFPNTNDNAANACTGSTANCTGLGCHVAAGGTGDANYCTDHNALNRAGATSVIMFPGDNHADAGEFYGMIDWVENLIEEMFRDHLDLLWPTLQTLLCGMDICMAVTDPVSSDLCIIMGDGGANANGTCFGNTGGLAQNMLFANRAFVKIFPFRYNASQTDLRLVIALYNVNQSYDPGNANYVAGDPVINWPPNTTTYLTIPQSSVVGKYSSTGYKKVGSSEVCVEMYLRGDVNGLTRIYTEALILRMDLRMVTAVNPISGEPSLIDICVTDGQMDFKGAQAQGNVGQNLNCDFEDGEDGGNDLVNAESINEIHDMIVTMVNQILHGSCPGAQINSACANYQTTAFSTGAGCQGQQEACKRSTYGGTCDNSITACGVLGSRCNISAYNMKHVVSTGIPPVDKWISDTAGRSEKEGGCTYGIFPMDVNNILSKYQPFSTSQPNYDPLDPRYGTMEVMGQIVDLGLFLNPLMPIEGTSATCTDGTDCNRLRVDMDIAIRPRWNEYWGCIDTHEINPPQYTYPDRLRSSGGVANGAFAEPAPLAGAAPNASTSYMIGLAISQDVLTELFNLLYSANFFCWDINHDNIFSLLNFGTSSTGAAGGFSFNALGEMLRVPAFALLAPGVESVADGDGYASIKLVPSGAASVRMGEGTYQYPVEYLEDIMPQNSDPKPGGLKGECYDDTGAGPGIFENYAGVLGAYPNAVTVWYNWGGGYPACVTSDIKGKQWYSRFPTADNFSLIFSGYVMAPFADTYTFCTRTDDGVRLFIDSTNVVNSWVDQGAPFPPTCGSISLTQGLHKIRMEYYENGGGAAAYLYWCVATGNSLGIRTCPVTTVDNGLWAIPKNYLYSSGTAAGIYTGTYGMMAKLPPSRFEVWAPLDDHTPGKVLNEPVRLFSMEAYMDIGIDIEYVRNQVKTLRYWGWDQGSTFSTKVGAFTDYFRIFAEIHPQLVDIKYAADQRLTQSQMQDALSGIFTSIASGYMQMMVETKLDVGAVLGIFKPGTAGQDVGLQFKTIGPGGPDGPAIRESQPPLFADNSSGDYLTTYLYIGPDTKVNYDMLKGLLPMVLGMVSLAPPVPAGPFGPVLSYMASGGSDENGTETESPVVTYIRAPSGVFFEDESDPAWTRGYALSPLQSGAAALGRKGTKIGFVGSDARGTTGVEELRYSSRFDGGLWGIPRYSQKFEMPDLLEGKHSFEVMAIAPDGTADSYPARLDFLVDNQPPRLKLQNVSEDTFITDENPSFVVEASDFLSQPENIRIAYRLDGGEIVDNGFSKIISLTDIKPPDHSLQILAQDEAGNVGGLSTKFMVDSKRGGFGCGTLANGGVNRVGTIVVIILLISFPIMLLIFLKVYYREKAEKKIGG